MNDLTSIHQLYTLFDRQFARPTAFFNMGCCIKKPVERRLLELSRGQLTDETLAAPISHYPGCFGTFDQIAYFIPRVVELLAVDEDLKCLNLEAFFSMLFRDRDEYEKRDLWMPLTNAIAEVFWLRTETFTIRHLADHGHQLSTGRILDHLDHVIGSEVLDAILGHFLCPALTPDPMRWNSFFEKWISDPQPQRTAHLLDMLKCRWEGNGPLTAFYTDIPLPESVARRLESDDFVLGLVERIKPLALHNASPTWLTDFFDAAAERPKV